MADDALLAHLLDVKNKLGQLQSAQETAERERLEGRADQLEIKDAIRALESRMNAMPDERHREHHEFITTMIAESQQRQRVRAAVLEKLASGGIWAGFVGIATLVWYGLKHKLGIGD
jgi:hypothetical protein